MALVQYFGKNVKGIGLPNGQIIRFLPGVNEIPQKNLDEIKTHPLFRSLIQKSQFKIVHEDTSGNLNEKLSVADMLSYINKTFDLKLLKKIINEDGRSAVVKAAEEQIDKIKSPKAKEKVNSDEHFS